MGDGADMLIEQMEDALFDEHWAPEFYSKEKEIPQCRYCGKTPLRWWRVGENWVLYEMDGKHHDCPNHTLPIAILKDILAKQKMIGQQLLNIPSWDETFMHDVY